MGRIELEGTITVGDTARFVYFHYLRRSWWVLIPLLLIVVTMLSLIALLWIVTGDAGLARSAGVPLLAVLGFWGWVFGWSPYQYSRKLLGSNAATGEAVRMVFDENGIDWQGPGASSHIDWSKVERVYETRTLYFLYIGPVAAMRIPKRFFQKAEQLDAWRKLVNEHVVTDRMRSSGWLGRYF